MSDKCKHEWEYYDLLCFPPIKKKRCKLCGYEHEWDLPQAEKVEDSGSEADFGTKDKEESWEDFCNLCTCKCDFRGSIKTPAFQCCSYLDFIKSLLEAEKQKAVDNAVDILIIFPKVLNESKECIDALLAKYKK